jgi:hypothetical protein
MRRDSGGAGTLDGRAPSLILEGHCDWITAIAVLQGDRVATGDGVAHYAWVGASRRCAASVGGHTGTVRAPGGV